MNEKERVYSELDDLRRRCFEQRREIGLLKGIATDEARTAFRREAAHYRKALANIAHRLDNGGVNEDDLRSIVIAALELKGIKPWKREQIARAAASSEERQ